MERWAVVLGLDTMSFPTHFDPLPPLGSSLGEDSPLLTNFDTDLKDSACLKCSGKVVPPELLTQHKNWHGRTNLLLRLRDLVTRDNNLGGGFGPRNTGALVVMDYENMTVWQKSTETEEDLVHYLNSKCWTLVNLRYVNGLKTTVGYKFTSRREGGDFVILNLDTPVLPLSDDGKVDDWGWKEWFVSPKETYFQLECRDDGALWISNKVETSSPTIVFVNGVPLCGAKLLEFGDVLSISVDDGRRGKRGFDLLFKDISIQSNPGKRSLIMENEEVIGIAGDGAQEKSLSNYLIVQNIIRWLPSTTMVKDCRLVCHLWNEEALKVLKEREREVIVTVCKPGVGPDHLMQMSNFTHSQLCPLGLSNWKMELQYFFGHKNQDHTDPKRMEQRAHIASMKEDKMLDDLTWFMEQPRSHDVSTLILSGDLDPSPKCVQMYGVLMSRLKERLTGLTLTLDVKGTFSTSPPLLFDSLTALQRLTIRVFGGKTVLIEQVVGGLLPSFGSITALCIQNGIGQGQDGWWEWRLGDTEFGRMVLSGVVNLQSTDPTKFGALTTIDLRSSNHDANTSNIESLSLLKRNSLESLDLGGIVATTCSLYSTQLRVALSTHAATLRQVTLQFSIVDQLHIAIPDRMESLESLTIRFEFRCSFLPNLWMALVTGTSRTVINYSQCLPSLSKLSLWPVKRIEEGQKGTLDNDEWREWGPFSPILAAFFATGTNANGRRVPVGSLKTLDIPFLLNGKYHQVLDDLEALFPNVDFPQSLQSSRWFERWEEPVVPEVGNDSDDWW